MAQAAPKPPAKRSSRPTARSSFGSDFRRHFIAGLFVLIPVVFTIWVLRYLFDTLGELGQPLVNSMIASTSYAPGDAHRIERLRRWLEVFKDLLSFGIVVVLIYLLGWFTTKVVGRRLLGLFDFFIHRIPLAKGIYGTTKQLLSTFQSKPEGAERVVLIDNPTPELKALGLLMRTFKDAETGRDLAAVFVPTAPSPTSGFVRVVPLSTVTNTQWTVDEAMRFLVSGGASGPETIHFDKSAEPRPDPPD
jgi:uncharacterized membrane protein